MEPAEITVQQTKGQITCPKDSQPNFFFLSLYLKVTFLLAGRHDDCSPLHIPERRMRPLCNCFPLKHDGEVIQ